MGRVVVCLCDVSIVLRPLLLHYPTLELIQMIPVLLEPAARAQK